MEQLDVIIIGSGTAGISALREVQKQTEKFVLINSGDWGTTCAARGCMPSKALIEATTAYHRRHDFAAFGLSGAESVQADIPAVLARVRRLRDQFIKGPEAVQARLGDRAISGRARLLGPGLVQVGKRNLAAKSVILATGSRPVVPKDWETFGEWILTTDSLFELPDLPHRIAVVGLGALGIEMAQALSRLGISVAGFDAVETLAGLSDPEVISFLRRTLEQEFPLYLGSPAQLSGSGGSIQVSNAAGSFTADVVLAAIGRRPNIEDLGLETLGVELDERGLPAVNPTTLQIGDLPVWLAGDANGALALQHEAADEGFIAGRNAMAQSPKSYCRRTELAIVFSSPSAARVGSRKSDLDPERTATGSVDYSEQGRALTAEKAAGLIQVYADIATGRLTGAELCAPEGEHLAHLLALAMQKELTVRELLAMPFYHPVIEEGLRTALRDLSRKVAGSAGSDLADCPPLGIVALD